MILDLICENESRFNMVERCLYTYHSDCIFCYYNTGAVKEILDPIIRGHLRMRNINLSFFEPVYYPFKDL